MKDKSEITIGGWHLRKEVTIGQILTLLSLLVSGIVWATSMENKVLAVDTRLTYEVKALEERSSIVEKNTNDRFDRYQRTVSEALGKIEGGIQRLHEKLDKKADK